MTFGPSVIAAAPTSGNLGISAKKTASYSRFSQRALRNLEQNRDPFLALNHAETSPEKVREDFSNFCLDGDSSDIVSWKTSSDGVLQVAFSCVLDGEFPKLRERLFVFKFFEKNLIDIQVGAAEPEEVAEEDLAKASKTEKLETSSPTPFLRTHAGHVVIAISSSMLKSGAAALNNRDQGRERIEIATLPFKEMGKGAALSGLVAAAGNFIFDLAPDSQGLAGGALSAAINEVHERRDPVTGQRQTIVTPLTLRLSFKFY